MNAAEKKLVQKKLAKLKILGRLQDKTIVLFGASADSRYLADALEQIGLNAEAVVDNDLNKQGRNCIGLRVAVPEDVLLPIDPRRVVLLYSKAYAQSMLLQLKRYGYMEKENVFCLSAMDSESLHVFFASIIRTVRGRHFYKRVIGRLKDHCTVFLMPYTGIGDVYLACTFLHEYLIRQDIHDYAFVVVNNACRQTASLFGIRNILVASQSQMDDLIAYQRFTRCDWPIVILNDAWVESYTNTIGGIRGFRKLNFDKMFRYFVFGLDDAAEHDVPQMDSADDELKHIFEANGLAEGRTVLLAPYANTLFRLPVEMWETIASRMKEAGFVVCTNCAGKHEPPIRGTIPLLVPIRQVIPFLNRAGYFIGVRSGLCDVICTSLCKKVILYDQDAVFHQSSAFDYFNLKDMKLCADAIEFEVNGNSSDGNAIMERIISSGFVS